MDMWIVAVIILTFLLIGGGCGLFYLKKTGKMKSVGKNINKTISVENIGVYEVNGTANEFHIAVNGDEMGFMVEKGIITAFKTKTSPNYKSYQDEGRRA